jgi:predicted DNA binding protein
MGMSIIAKVHFSHPDMALANIIESFPDVAIRVLQEASTDPVSNTSFFIIETDQTDALEREFDADHTVEAAEQVSWFQDWPVYSVEFSPNALLLGSVVTDHGGFALDAQQHDGGWVERWQLPDRASFQAVWEYALDQSFTFDIIKINQVPNDSGSGIFGMTDKQRATIAYAYNNGYFDDPGEITLAEIAEEFGISTTAASGRIRRGVKAIIESTVPEADGQ